MRVSLILALAAVASGLAPASSLNAFRPHLTVARTVSPKAQQQPVGPNGEALSYEDYMAARAQAQAQMPGQAPAPTATMPQSTRDLLEEYRRAQEQVAAARAPVPPQVPVPGPRPVFKPIREAPRQVGTLDTDESYERVPWWRQGSEFTEAQRKDRRTIFMHDDWVRHRQSDRFFRNMQSIGSSGINQALFKELGFVTGTAIFVVLFNMLFYNYQDFAGVVHPGPLNMFDGNIKALSLPALPFSIAMPALSLLLVFRTNTAYFRWNEARTLWGGLINNCRNIVRQSNTFFPDDPYHNELKRRMAAETHAFIRSLRNFLRGPTDDNTLRTELYEMVDQGLMCPEQADAVMAASNRPMFCLSGLSATLRKANIDTIQAGRIDSTISTLVDLTGANERIFKSPIPLVYSRLTARFLTVFLVLLPLALWALRRLTLLVVIVGGL